MGKKYRLKKKYKIGFILVLMLAVILSTAAVSYSLWFVTKEQKDTNLVTSGCFSILYNDLDDNEKSSSINLNNTYPISDELGMQLAPYRVTIKNTCSVAANYTFLLSSIEDNTLDENYLKVFLKKDTTEYGPIYFNELNAIEMNKFNKEGIETEKSIKIKNSYILATGMLNPDDEEVYEFRMWVSKEAGSDMMEKEFGSIISFEAYATKSN